jgi:very-short-patch-repair endonuclease
MNKSRLSINARNLRKRQTRAEELLWRDLRARQLEDAKFRRQVPIGDYIVDFISFEKKIIVELDGGQHAATTTRDAARDAWLKGRGYSVLRFWDNEVFQNLEGILEVVRKNVASIPSP